MLFCLQAYVTVRVQVKLWGRSLTPWTSFKPFGCSYRKKKIDDVQITFMSRGDANSHLKLVGQIRDKNRSYNVTGS